MAKNRSAGEQSSKPRGLQNQKNRSAPSPQNLGSPRFRSNDESFAERSDRPEVGRENATICVTVPEATFCVTVPYTNSSEFAELFEKLQNSFRQREQPTHHRGVLAGLRSFGSSFPPVTQLIVALVVCGLSCIAFARVGRGIPITLSVAEIFDLIVGLTIYRETDVPVVKCLIDVAILMCILAAAMAACPIPI